MEDKDLPPREPIQHIEHQYSNQQFKFTRKHGDRTTEFDFSSPPKHFIDELIKLTSWIPALEERLEISHHEEEDRVTRFAGTIANPSYAPKWNDRIIFVDATLTEVTVTLERAVDSRRLLVLKQDSSANHVVIVAFTSDIGSDDIEGNPSLTLSAQYDKALLRGDSDVHRWYSLDV